MSMRKIREVLRLTHELGFSVRAVCEATGVGKTAVGDYVRRAKLVGPNGGKLPALRFTRGQHPDPHPGLGHAS